MSPVHLRWGGFFSLQFAQFAHGAWIAGALSLLLLAGSGLRLLEHRRMYGERRLLRT